MIYSVSSSCLGELCSSLSSAGCLFHYVWLLLVLSTIGEDCERKETLGGYKQITLTLLTYCNLLLYQSDILLSNVGAQASFS